MNMLSGLAYGFEVLLGMPMFLVLGAAFGLAAGSLSCVSPAGAVALLLPVLFSFSPQGGIVMLTAAAVGAVNGRTLAALRNSGGEGGGSTAGETSPVFPAMLASMVSAFMAAIAVVGLTPMLADFALNVGPAEHAAAMVFVLIGGAALANGSAWRAASAVALGLLLSTVGTDVHTGLARLTFGVFELADGISVVAVALGLFVVADVIGALIDSTDTGPSASSLSPHGAGSARAALRGLLMGVLPGDGSSLTTSQANSTGTRTDPLDPATQERPDLVSSAGVAGNARIAGSMLPFLGLGIPTNALAALLMAAYFMFGINPGATTLAGDQPSVAFALLATLLVAPPVILLSVAFIPLAALSRLASRAVAPVVLMAACVLSYMINLAAVDVVTTIVFGALGHFLVRHGYERGLLLVAFTMGPMLEENLSRVMLLTRGDLSLMLARPVSAALLVGALILIVVVRLRMRTTPQR